MMELGPFHGKIWAHSGRRLFETTGELASIAGGLVVTDNPPGPIADQVHRGPFPVMMQSMHDAHRSDTDQLKLFIRSPEEADDGWLSQQMHRQAAVITTRTVWLPRPASSTQARSAVRELPKATNRFLTLVDKRCSGMPATALVAVDYRWLRDSGLRSSLIEGLSSINGPVSLMVTLSGGDIKDPFGDVRSIEGLAALIDALDSFSLLRSDHAALGAFALGAVSGSIGLGTNTRHYPLADQRGFKNLDDKTARLLVPSVWAFWRGSRFETSPDISLYRCECSVCRGDSIRRFYDPRLAPEADRHTVACWTAVADELRQQPSGTRESSWLAMCGRAVENLNDLFMQHEILEHPSSQLKAWCEFAGIRVV